MLISVPSKSQLLEAGPSALSGIRLNLPDGTYFGIGPIMANEDFDDYMREDCKLVDMPNKKARRISCPHSEHTLLYTSAGAKGVPGIFTDIKHEFEGNSPSRYYTSIVDSLQLLHVEEADNAARVVAAMASPDFDPANPLTQPRIFCGKDRIRSSILHSTPTSTQ